MSYSTAGSQLRLPTRLPLRAAQLAENALSQSLFSIICARAFHIRTLLKQKSELVFCKNSKNCNSYGLPFVRGGCCCRCYCCLRPAWAVFRSIDLRHECVAEAPGAEQEGREHLRRRWRSQRRSGRRRLAEAPSGLEKRPR